MHDRRRKKLILMAVFSLAIMGLIGKVLHLTQTVPDASAAIWPLADPPFIPAGFSAGADVPLTVDGIFIARIYTAHECDGFLIALPSVRNAESSRLLSAKFGNHIQYVIYTLDGSTFSTYPAVQHWLAQLKARIPGYSQEPAPIVWQLAATAACVPLPVPAAS